MIPVKSNLFLFEYGTILCPIMLKDANNIVCSDNLNIFDQLLSNIKMIIMVIIS